MDFTSPRLALRQMNNAKAPNAPVSSAARTPQEVLDSLILQLPPMPAAVTNVLNEVRKPEPDLQQIERWISADHALSSQILRVVNSAYYGLSRQISSIGQAVIILGLQQVYTITMSVGAIIAIAEKFPGNEEISRTYWEKSLSATGIVKAIAKSHDVNVKTLELVTTGAILHDLGRVFVQYSLPETWCDIIADWCVSGNDIERSEAKFLGMNHALLGGKILDKWNLPVELIQLVRDHESTSPNGWTTPMAILHLADFAGKKIYFKSLSEHPEILPNPAALDTLDLDSEKFAQIVEDVRKRVEEAESSLDAAS
jgi:HD-like signal output (HDOD) protein